MAFWPGLGFNDLQAGPKANGSQAKARPGQTKAKPKSHGFLASGQSQAVTSPGPVEVLLPVLESRARVLREFKGMDLCKQSY